MNWGMTALYVQCSKKAFYSLALFLQIWTLVNLQLVDEQTSAEWAKVHSALWRTPTRQAGLCLLWAKVPSVTGASVAKQHRVFWGRLQPALHSEDAALHLGFWEKRICEGNKTEWNGSKMLAKLKLHWIYTYWIFEVSWQEKLPSLQITEGLFYRINTLTEKS